MRWGCRGRWVAAGLLFGLPFTGPGPLAASSAATEVYPRILEVRSDGDAQVFLDVVVPPLLSGETLPASAFVVTQNGRRSQVTSAARLVPARQQVVLVLDPTVPPAVLAAEQGAARELVFALPALTQVGVVAGGPAPEELAPPGTDREATVRALLALRPEPVDGAVDVSPSLGVAVTQLGSSGGGVVIAVDSRPTAVTVPYDLSQTVLATRTALYSILLRPGPAGYLGGLPSLTGGRVLQLTGPEQLVGAFDTVRAELLGRYRIGYRQAEGSGRSAQLIVAARGVRAATTFDVRAAPAPAAPASHHRTRPVRIILAGLVVLVVSAALAWRLAGTPA